MSMSAVAGMNVAPVNGISLNSLPLQSMQSMQSIQSMQSLQSMQSMQSLQSMSMPNTMQSLSLPTSSPPYISQGSLTGSRSSNSSAIMGAQNYGSTTPNDSMHQDSFIQDEEMHSGDEQSRKYETNRTSSPQTSEGRLSPQFVGTRTNSPTGVDETLEPDSEDELFINEGPSLDDDDSFQGNGDEFSNNFDESSTFLDDEDTTYGSPGLREAFGEGGFTGALEQDSNQEQDLSRAGSADNSRRNKRKNFRPRNIIYSTNESEGEEKAGVREDNSPMDLSVASRPHLDSDSESETGSADTKPKPGGLSVVRNEILFGKASGPTGPTRMGCETTNNLATSSPLSILSSLSGMSNVLNPFMRTEDASTATTMKDAFREVLKLYGMSSELVDSITQSSQDYKQEKKAEPPRLMPGTGVMHPGMLSAALQGGMPPHHPPTPPRTPQGPKDPSSPLNLPFLSLQAYMKPGLGHINPQMPKQLQGIGPGVMGYMPPLPPHMMGRVSLMPGKAHHSADYTRYFKRFGSSLECGFHQCKELNYREHFHCAVPLCKGKDFAKKEEMIRHSKWHQKMDEALKYGFRRVTPMDDCSNQFLDCGHNKKQTHYHCIQADGCDKVYISTSDVQMHFNYHRKDNAIQREGFLRFRGAEDCHTSYCLYRGQKTTHFHCNRTSCQFTFKNKADMEKHKNYHMKDEQLNKDGFKKFMKHEPCGFNTCKFSRTHNHIHCIRPQCEYVLHSSGQLFSHKRKHERKDSELAYRKYKMSQSLGSASMDSGLDQAGGADRPPSSGSLASGCSTPPLQAITPTNHSASQLRFPGLGGSGSAVGHPDVKREPAVLAQLPQMIPEDVWQNYLLRFDAEEGCGFQECEVEDTEHFHCKDEGCETVFRTEEGVREHGRNHYLQDCISASCFNKVDPEEPGTEVACPSGCVYTTRDVHYHCRMEHCEEVILCTDQPFRRLDHYKIHEYSKKWQAGQSNLMFPHQFGGTPSSPTPQAVFTSFKLPKPGSTPSQMPDFGGMVPPYSFPGSVLRPPVPHFVGAGHHFQMKTEPGMNIAVSTADDLKPVSPPTTNIDDSEKIRQNNNNRQDKDSAGEESSPPKNQGLIKARGTYFPLTAFPTSMPQGSVMRRDATPPGTDKSVAEEASPPISMKSTIGLNFMVSVGRSLEAGENALAKLLQASQDFGFGDKQSSTEQHLRPSDQHLRLSDQHLRLSDQQRTSAPELRYSLMEAALRESGGGSMEPSSPRHDSPSPRILSPSNPSPNHAASPSPMSLPSSPVVSSAPSSNHLNFANPFGLGSRPPFLPTSPGLLPPGMNPFFPHGGMMLAGVPNPFQRFPAADPRLNIFDPTKGYPRSPWQQKRSNTLDMEEDLMSMDQKKMRLQTSMRMLKDEPVPDGYMRYRFNEDCQFTNCNYREHQTHFHCMRKDCNYRFCDKTRFVQHTARHERLDTLCGEEFEGYRGVPCGREDCELNTLHNSSRFITGANQKSSSHFHCLKCDYYCTDTNKVVAHRRQHQKLDSIMAAGFEKYTPTQYCTIPGCSHNGKQTHYHCRKCQYAVLGLSQMEAHKYRHLNE